MKPTTSEPLTAAFCSPLVWSTEIPTVEGWYWIKAPNLSPRIDRFTHPSWDKKHCYCPYSGGDVLKLHGRPYEYAGPLPEPNVQAVPAAAGGSESTQEPSPPLGTSA